MSPFPLPPFPLRIPAQAWTPNNLAQSRSPQSAGMDSSRAHFLVHVLTRGTRRLPRVLLRARLAAGILASADIERRSGRDGISEEVRVAGSM